MKRQVNVTLDTEIIDKIDSILLNNPKYASRAHFVELAILNYLERATKK